MDRDHSDRYHLDELGVVMAARWDLPPVISDAISLHHSAERTAASDPSIVEVVVEVGQVIALLATHTRLGVEQLEEVESFTLREREVLVKAIEALPGFVASFESGEVWKSTEARSLVAAGPPQPAEPSRFSCPVVLKLADRQHSYRLLGMGGTHCMVTGKDPSRRICSCSSRWP